MVRNCNFVVRNGKLWYEMAMVRNGYGTKWQWYEMVMVRNYLLRILCALNVVPYNNPISSLQIKENVGFVAWQFVLSG